MINMLPCGTRVRSGASACLPSGRIEMSSGFPMLLSWRTFTLSQPLQPGVWLLRRLRRPHRLLTFSPPGDPGKAVREFPSSRAQERTAPFSCLVYAGRIGDNTWQSPICQAQRHPLWGQGYHPFSPVQLPDVSDPGFSRQPRSQDWSVNRLW